MEDRIRALQAQADQLETQVDRQARLAGWAASAADFCQRVRTGLDDADFARRRQLVELLIDRVVVTEGDVKIRYVIPLSPDAERVSFCHLRKDYFNPPAQFGHVNQIDQGGRRRQGREPVLGRLRVAAGHSISSHSSGCGSARQ